MRETIGILTVSSPIISNCANHFPRDMGGSKTRSAEKKHKQPAEKSRKGMNKFDLTQNHVENRELGFFN